MTRAPGCRMRSAWWAAAPLRQAALLLAASGLLLGAGCTSGPGARKLTVLAASSLTDAFGEVAAAFESRHPGETIELSFAGTAQLLAQVEQGAPASVIATADRESMERLASAGLLAGAAQIFAGNRLTIVVAPGNPEGIATLTDLARPGLVVALSDPSVPAGRYAREAVAKAGAGVSPATLEASVRGVLNKVAFGEADAGIVYATDARAAGDTVSTVEIPDSLNVTAAYPIAALAAAPSHEAAETFIDFVLSDAGRAVMAAHGFMQP